MSARYRKKPIPVEARQVPKSKDGQSGLDLAAWCGGAVSGTYAEPTILVPTLEGELTARVGDWIVKGPRGEFWPVKGDIFAETYEPVSPAPKVGMSARETLNRWVEAMQILCGKDDNPGQQRRAGYDETRQQMLNAAYTEVRREGARLLEDAACDADWTRTPDYCAGLRAGAELLLANTGEKATTEAATATPTLTAETIRHAADSVSHIHETCAKDRTTCLGCRVRADILDVLHSVADVIRGSQ